MQKLLLSIGVLFSVYAHAQVNVYECGVVNPSVTPSEVLNGAYGFYRPCIEFGTNHDFQFSGDVHKDIKASEYIHIQEGFHAGFFNENKGVHLRIAEKSLFDVAVLNYPDLNHIQKFKKVEFGVDLEGEIEDRIKAFLANTATPTLYHLNPFIEDDMNPNTSEISMHATFIHPSTWTVKERDFFYYHEYEQAGPGYGVNVTNNNGDDGWSDSLNDNNDYLMRVRFAPPQLGEWEAHFSITYDGMTIQLPVFTFLVEDNNHPGFVKVHNNNRNLQRGTSIVFPLGHVLPGPYNRANGEQVPWGDPVENKSEYNTTVADWNQYLGDVESYIAQGAKSFKLAQTSYGNLIEFEELGNYRKRLQYAWEQDKILDMCEENDVLVNFNLLFQDVIMGYGQNGGPKPGGGYWGDPWDYGNYGPDGLQNPNDYYPPYCYFVQDSLPSNQFLDPILMNYHKQRTRYYVARYGYSPQIYTWELMSEPFHMDQFANGTFTAPNGNELSDEPASIYFHPGHQVAIEAINTYHNELSDYIKNELEDTDHLITLQQANEENNPYIYPYQSAFSPWIDIIGYNIYGDRPDKLVRKKDDKNGKNNLVVEYSDNPNKDEISTYKTIIEKFWEIGKPIILSEAGHANPPVLDIECYGTTGNTIDAMTLGFTGVAAMHPWEGYSYGYTNASGDLQFDGRFLWPATISAEKHMNSEKVIPTLDHWDGNWKQGRQIEKVYPGDDALPKELQYYLAQSNELATGYVRNRSYNAYTERLGDDCHPLIWTIPYSDGFEAPLDDFFSFYHYTGNNSNGKNNHLYVTGLQKKKWYEIKWYDFITGDLILTQWQQTDNKFRMELHYPSMASPILWFSMERDFSKSIDLESDEEEIDRPQNQSFSIYPNPFTGNITIFSPQDDTIEIRSVIGALVGSYSITVGKTIIRLDQLSSGVYFVTSKHANITLKIVKQ